MSVLTTWQDVPPRLVLDPRAEYEARIRGHALRICGHEPWGVEEVLRQRRYRPRVPKRRVVVGGVKYASVKAAAAELRVKAETIYEWVRTGRRAQYVFETEGTR